MRSPQFVAEHRGGLLSLTQHRLLAAWAADCAERAVGAYWCDVGDDRPSQAIRLARAWSQGEISVGEARKASVAAHAAARAANEQAAVFAARASGHAVAVAHMADHSLGASYYAVKACIAAGHDPNAEQKWLDDRIPAELYQMVVTAQAARFSTRNGIFRRPGT